MSAFIVSKLHIDAIVTAGIEAGTHYEKFSWYHGGQRRELSLVNANQVGGMLMAENVRSVAYRYRDSLLEDLPGPANNEWMDGYRFQRFSVRDERGSTRRLTPVEVFKALDGYEYQACEHPEWEESEAFAFIQGLRRALIRRLPGYSDAETWHITSRGPVGIPV